MLYYLIDKIVVWNAGITILAMLSYALIWAYDGLAHRWRKCLLGSPPKRFRIESIAVSGSEFIDKVLESTGLGRLNSRTQDMVMNVLAVPLFTIVIPLGFLTIGLRYTWKRWHTTAAPSVLA